MTDRVARLRGELMQLAQTATGSERDDFTLLVRDVSVALDANHADIEPVTIPAVNRDALATTDGRPADEVRIEQRNEPGMHKSYIVLSDDERAKGFVRPVRNAYVHEKCGTLTRIGSMLAETYARYPKFYGATFCVGCNAHYPVGESGEFLWADGDKSKVGS